MPDPEFPQALDVAEEISHKTRIDVIKILSEGEGNLRNIPQEEVLAILQQIAGAKGLQLNFTTKADDKEEGPAKETELPAEIFDIEALKKQTIKQLREFCAGKNIKLPAKITKKKIIEKIEDTLGKPEVEIKEKEEEKRELTPEEAKKTLKTLKARFEENTYLHEGIKWSDVKPSLEADPQALWSIAQMEAAGHEPDVYHEDNNHYFLGTCSKKTPESTRNTLYNKKELDYILKKGTPYPKLNFKGFAVEMAKKMGISLMTLEHYIDILQEKGKFDEKTRCLLLTEPKILSKGEVVICSRVGYSFKEEVEKYKLELYQTKFGFYSPKDNCGWRGSLKVKKLNK